MNARKLNTVFKEIKQEAGLDYAYTNVDRLGDCNTCVCDRLCDLHGEKSTGIYLKHWRTGMNARGAVKEQQSLYINHDLNEEQGKKVIEILGKHYNLESTEYDPRKAFHITEKEA